MTKSKVVNWINKTALKEDLIKVCDEVGIDVVKGSNKKNTIKLMIEAIDEKTVEIKDLSTAIKQVDPQDSIYKKLTGGRTKTEIAKAGGKNLLKVGLLGGLAFFAGKMGGATNIGNDAEESDMITDDASQM